MARLFVGNFEFEHRLASPHEAVSRHVLSIGQELTFLWLLAAKDGDAIVFDATIEPEFLKAAADSGLPRVEVVSTRGAVNWLQCESNRSTRNELVPWGWEPASLAFASSLLQELPHPEFAAVRKANSRRTSFALESEWGIGLTGSRELTSLGDLSNAIEGLSPDFKWVIKAEFGMSARERVLGRGPRCSANDSAWVQKRLQRDGAVYFEPWVERVAEYGMQFEIQSTRAIDLFGVLKLHVDTFGGYQGSSLITPDEPPALRAAIDACERTANFLKMKTDYHGPVGFDVMHYRNRDGDLAWRPLQDINARWTMGRLTLEGLQFARPDETAELLFLPWLADGNPATYYDKWRRQQPARARCLRLTPFTIDGTPTRRGGVFRIVPRNA